MKKPFTIMAIAGATVMALVFTAIQPAQNWATAQEASKDGPARQDVAPAKGAITHEVLEQFSPELSASIESYRRLLFSAGAGGTPGGAGSSAFSFIVQEWSPGQTLRVAFLGGTAELHKDIADATKDWTDACNIKLDFKDPGASGFRTWSTSDTAYKAEIRISFDMKGYWSLVGNDSANPLIGAPGQPDGGRPNQRSMNFGGFLTARPFNWRSTVLHEFGHALGFQHEHQSPSGVCESEFRFNDDPGYTPTVDGLGQFVADASGRRPGVYTVLGGPPNNWPSWMVDHNLKGLTISSAFRATTFDRASIMKYSFPDWMFANGAASTCFSAGQNVVLSATDKAAALEIYPFAAPAVAARVDVQNQAHQLVEEAPRVPANLKSISKQLRDLKQKVESIPGNTQDIYRDLKSRD